jgi:hypothetical protein
MVSMSLATWAMAVWGVTLVLMDFAPRWAPSWGWATALSSLFALPGLVLAILTVRARRSWFLVAMVPVAANGMALVLPWVALHLSRG